MPKTNLILGTPFLNWLETHGVLDPGRRLVRCVIDAPLDGPVTLYVHEHGTMALLDVDLLAGLRIVAGDQAGQAGSPQPVPLAPNPTDIPGAAFLALLQSEGILPPGHACQRVIVDAHYNQAVQLYWEEPASASLLQAGLGAALQVTAEQEAPHVQ